MIYFQLMFRKCGVLRSWRSISMVTETCNVKFLYFNLGYYMYFVRLVVTHCWLPACSVRFSDPGDCFLRSLLLITVSNLQVHVFTKAHCNLVAVFSVPAVAISVTGFPGRFFLCWYLFRELGKMYTWGGVRLRRNL